MRRTLLGLLTAGALALTACSSSDGGSASEPGPTESTSAPAGPQSYGSVVDLKDAAVDAGYSCPRWRQNNKVTLAAESGICDSDSVLSTYASEQDLQDQLDTEKQLEAMFAEAGMKGTPMLVGPNWILKDNDAADLKDALGGVVVSPK